MGATKPNPYSNEDLLISKFGRAIAHPARAKIIRMLLQNHNVRNVDLTIILNLSLSCVHNHIQALRDASIVELTYQPHEYYLKLNTENFEFIKKLLG